MTPRRPRGPAAALPAGSLGAALVATLIAACGAPKPQTAPASATSAASAAPSSAPGTEARRRWAPADVHFVSGMIHHHAQAIDMSRLAPTHGASSPVQVLAGRIINAQRDEITLMQQWLRDRGQPVPEARATGMTMTMGGMTHEMLMPGMLTPEQMRQLDAAHGAEFDRLFLQFMIQHHRGAVAMVNELFATPGAAQDDAVFKLANDVSVDQTTEIARMQKMLAGLIFERPTSSPR